LRHYIIRYKEWQWWWW